MIPLLQTPLQNPHATLITLFMNAVEETLTDEDRMQGMTSHSRETKDLFQYIRANSGNNPDVITKLTVGRELVAKYDHIFDR
jgi:uncharacterized membrane protein (DUF106 family)